MNKPASFLAKFNRITGQTGQIILFVFIFFALLDHIADNSHGKGYYLFVIVAIVAFLAMLTVSVLLLISSGRDVRS